MKFDKNKWCSATQSAAKARCSSRLPSVRFFDWDPPPSPAPERLLASCGARGPGAGGGVSELKERTISSREAQRGPASVRVAEEVFFLSRFTALGACATQGTGGVRAESDLDKN